jgi:hypothetical protein
MAHFVNRIPSGGNRGIVSVDGRDRRRQRALIEAKFLRREGEGGLPQKEWNIAADLEIALASATAPIVEDGRLWLSEFRRRS